MVTQARRLPFPTLSGRSAVQLLMPAFAALLVVLLVVWLGVNLIKTPSDFYQLFLIGLTNGAIYGLVALGYSLVYGILELINFAHGDVFMVGAMLVATMVTSLGLAGDSGLFVWAKAPDAVGDVEAWLDEILHATKVFINPGFVFGEAGRRHLRVSLCRPAEAIGEAVERVERFIESLAARAKDARA